MGCNSQIIEELRRLNWIPSSGSFKSPELDYCIQLLNSDSLEELNRIFQIEWNESIPSYYHGKF
jgi:hypothetical protein